MKVRQSKTSLKDKLSQAVTATKDSVRKTFRGSDDILENIGKFLRSQAKNMKVAPDSVSVKIGTRQDALSMSLWCQSHWQCDLEIISLVKAIAGPTAALVPGIKERVQGSLIRGLKAASEGHSIPIAHATLVFSLQEDQVQVQVFKRRSFVGDVDLNQLAEFFQ